MKHAIAIRLAVGCCLLSTGCKDQPTQLLAIVYTDFAVPDEFSTVLVEDLAGDTPPLTLSFANSSENQLNALSFAIVPGDDDLDVDIRVSGRQGEVTVVSSSVNTNFIPGRALRLPIYLLKTCRDQGCGADTDSLCEVSSLGAAMCIEDNFVDADNLQDLDEQDVRPAGSDAGSDFDGGLSDAGMDPMDADLDSGSDGGGADEDAGSDPCTGLTTYLTPADFMLSGTLDGYEPFDVTATIPVGDWRACGGPLNASTMSACANAGDIDDALTIVDSLGDLIIVDQNYYADFSGYFAGVNSSGQNIQIDFVPPIRAVGFFLLSDDEAEPNVEVEIALANEHGAKLESTLLTTSMDMKEFIGMRCDDSVVHRVVIRPTNGLGPYTFVDEIYWEH